MRKNNGKRLLTGILCVVLVLSNIGATGISVSAAELGTAPDAVENQGEESGADGTDMSENEGEATEDTDTEDSNTEEDDKDNKDTTDEGSGDENSGTEDENDGVNDDMVDNTENDEENGGVWRR